MDYYVYVCRVDGEVAYVGYGRGGRFKHCTSGTSHNIELNKAVILGKVVTVDKHTEGLPESEARKLEKQLILQMKPAFNKTNKSISVSFDESSLEVCVGEYYVNSALVYVQIETQRDTRKHCLTVRKMGLESVNKVVKLLPLEEAFQYVMQMRKTLV